MRLLHMFAATLVTVLWSANYIAFKAGMITFPPFFYVSLRFFIVAALLLPFAPAPSFHDQRRLAAFAFTLCVGNMALAVVGVAMGLTVSTSVLVSQLGAPFSCLLGVIFLKDRIGPWRSLGLAIALLGTLLLAGTPEVLSHKLAFALALLSAFCWGVSNIQVKGFSSISLLQLLAWQALFAAPMLLAVSLLVEGPQWHALAHAPRAAWLAVAYTVFGSTLGAYGLWSYLLRMYPVSQVAPFALLMPLSGVLFGVVLYHEPLTPGLLAGALLTMLGVAIIVVRRPKIEGLGERI